MQRSRLRACSRSEPAISRASPARSGASEGTPQAVQSEWRIETSSAAWAARWALRLARAAAFCCSRARVPSLRSACVVECMFAGGESGRLRVREGEREGAREEEGECTCCEGRVGHAPVRGCWPGRRRRPACRRRSAPGARWGPWGKDPVVYRGRQWVDQVSSLLSLPAPLSSLTTHQAPPAASPLTPPPPLTTRTTARGGPPPAPPLRPPRRRRTAPSGPPRWRPAAPRAAPALGGGG